ncbi:MAG: four helix bundle protein [Candidatus Pacebacteria bacterium]|nr:four helix bundle protein [Candidatus Paceibacterota bacterium]
METNTKSKKYDLEERTFNFAKNCRILIKKIPKTISNIEDGKQLARSSGSVHSNYIEANESLSKKDFYFRIKICRKEAKESLSWLKLLDTDDGQREILVIESTELMKIFGSIITKERNV